MRRRHGDNTDSLEMLLDALCNMFGGIIFIALLVAIMSTESRDQTPVEPVAAQSLEARTLEHQQQALQEQLASLEDGDAATLEAIKAAAARSAETDARTQRIDQLASELEVRTPPVQLALQQARDELKRLEDLTQTLKQAKDNPDLKDVDRETQDIEDQIQRLEARLHGAAHRRTVNARLGLERRTSKMRVFLWIDAGRAWVMCYDTRGQGNLKLDSHDPEHVLYTHGSDWWHYKPRPGKGMPVTTSLALRSHPMYGRMLRLCPPSRYFVEMRITPSGHDTFMIVRQALLNSGYTYNLDLANGLRQIVFSSGNVDGSVQ
ncbi:MAG: hypothetical protein MK101_09745 [Phycisphaerales bacterium]|nr:hypothetical protein [Phycisphaerales bacterium]